MVHLQVPSTSLNATVAYIGHSTCVHKGGINCTENGLGLTLQKFGLVTITNDHGQSSETVTLAHELGHMFGIRDHYGLECPSTEDMKKAMMDSTYDKNCIYGENDYQTISLSSAPVCQGCRNRVAKFISQYKG